jgi:hypothetical protein
MKSYKTTLAGLITGLPILISAIMEAYNSGQFQGKNALELVFSIGIVMIGVFAKDHQATT